MEMQDKEFDDMFNSKLGDLQMEPSARVWDEITDELDGKKAKRSIMPWLTIAASVIVLVTAGILFLGKNTKRHGKHTKPDQLALNQNHAAVKTKDDTGKTIIEPVITAKSNNRVASTLNRAAHQNLSQANNVTVPHVIKEVNTNKETEPPAKADDQQLLASIPQTESNVLQGVVPGREIKLAPRSLDIEDQAQAGKPIAASDAKPVTTGFKKHGIHSLGGLINVLVAKVDKRQDKLIEFTDSDDDDTESSITGVNLGIIKIKKQ
jgi:hypothetical protein